MRFPVMANIAVAHSANLNESKNYAVTFSFIDIVQ